MMTQKMGQLPCTVILSSLKLVVSLHMAVLRDIRLEPGMETSLGMDLAIISQLLWFYSKK
jgi:hypothetical protein